MDILDQLPQGYSFVFFLIAFLSAFGYALQSTLTAVYGRQFDPFVVTACRGLSFIITFLPLLLIIPPGSFAKIIPFIWILLLASLFGALSVALIFRTQCFFPIGITAAFQQMSQIWLLILGFFLLHDRIGWKATFAIVIIIGGVISLSLQKSRMPHLKAISPLEFIYAFLFPFLLGASYFLMAYVARETQPLATAYVWEVFIGVFAALILLFNRLILKKKPDAKAKRLSAKDVFYIAVASSGTLIGTGGIAILYILGSPGVGQTAVNSMLLILMSLFGIVFFREHLKGGQWLSIGVTIVGIIALKIVTA